MPKYLGIDYGLKRVGIAVSDPGLSISFARDHLINDNELLNALMKLVKEEEILKIIVGLPVSISGEENEQTRVTKEFAENLSSILRENGLTAQLEFMDERLTSKIAGAEIISAVPRKSKRRNKGLIDESSARIILQNFLDRERNMKNR